MDTFKDKSAVYIMMELASGGEVYDMIGESTSRVVLSALTFRFSAERGYLTENEAAPLFQQLLEG
jgi:serine/threonine protein kinase